MEKREHIVLTNDEALVLFEWLSKLNNSDQPELFVHSSEQEILFNIESQLEKSLSQPLKSNYQELVLEARNKIINNS